MVIVMVAAPAVVVVKEVTTETATKRENVVQAEPVGAKAIFAS
jgi:hypothetical protein